MEELKHKENLPVQASAEGHVLMVEFGNAVTQKDLKLFAGQIQEMFEQMQANQNLNAEKTQKKIDQVERKIESKYISPQELSALESLVDKKASKYVNDKKGIQLNIDVFLNYDQEGLVKYQKLINDEVGKTKSKIWVDLHKKCLEQKGTTPKNRILSTQVEQAFDYVRTWGGFSI